MWLFVCNIINNKSKHMIDYKINYPHIMFLSTFIFLKFLFNLLVRSTAYYANFFIPIIYY